MSPKLTSSDRKTLIRIASSMEKGSTERKAILAGLEKTASEGSLDRLMRDWFTKLSLDMVKMAEAKMKVRNLGPDGFSFTLDFWTDSARNQRTNVDGQVRLIGIGSRAKLELAFGNEEWTFPLDTARKAIVAKWRELNSYDDHPFARRSAASKTAYSDKFGLKFNFRSSSGFSFTTVPVDPPYNQTYTGYILMKKPGKVKAYNAAMDYIRKNERQISRMKKSKDVLDAINGYARKMTGKEPYWHYYLMPD